MVAAKPKKPPYVMVRCLGLFGQPHEFRTRNPRYERICRDCREKTADRNWGRMACSPIHVIRGEREEDQ